MGYSPAVDDLPHELRVGGHIYVVTRAVAADVAAVVALLRDDELGAARESVTTDDLSPYRRAFEQIDADPHQLLVVVRRRDEVEMREVLVVDELHLGLQAGSPGAEVGREDDARLSPDEEDDHRSPARGRSATIGCRLES